MAIKMRVLYASNKSKIADMADIVKQEYDLAINAVDKIPPAYSCNNERIVILMLSQLFLEGSCFVLYKNLNQINLQICTYQYSL